MNNQERTSILPTILVAILALFGLATIPQGQGKRPEGTEASAKASVEGAEHKSEVKKPNHLGPLNTLKDYWQNCGPYAGPPGSPSPKEDVSEKELLKNPPNLQLQFLIVLVPDPDGTSMSHVFDSTLSAVLRATESAGYLAERRWFPWEPLTRDRSKDETKPTHVKGTLADMSLNATVGKEENPKNEDQPGGVLCSRVSRSSPTENELLMVLLVPETPIWGVDKTRLGQAFKIVANYREFHRVPPARHAEFLPPCPRFLAGNCLRWLDHAWRIPEIRIVGPNFSGSIPSMVMEIKTWIKTWRASHIAPHLLPVIGAVSAAMGNLAAFEATKILSGISRPRFVIYNGAALEPALDVLREAFRDGQVTFRSTVHNTPTLVSVLREFTHDTSVSKTSPVHRALLVESNTDFGQRFLRPTNEKIETRFFERIPANIPRGVDFYVFPMNISRLREEYTARGYYQSHEPTWLSAPERLSLQAMTSKVGDRDLMPNFTPSPTAVEGEMILTQILQEVKRLRYPWIGFVATNPHDQLFLAYKVRQVCPSARLCFITATSLFTHRDIVPYLRGSLVASTYPLYLGTQSWTAPMQPARPASVPRVGFSSDFTEGIYNATVAHLSELEPDPAARPPAWLDYSFPGEAQDRTQPSAPPIWISVVGEHGLYPLSVRHPRNNALATPDMEQKESIGGVYIPKPLYIEIPPNPDALRPQLHPSWVVVFLAVSVAGLIGSVYYLWVCGAPVEGSKTRWPAWFRVSPALRERLDHPAGLLLATLAVAGGLLLLLLLGLPAWGLARIEYQWPPLDEDWWCLVPIGGLALAAGILALLVTLCRLVGVVPPFLRAFIRPTVGRRKYIWWAFASVMMILVPGLLVSVYWLQRPPAVLLLDCERMTRLSCGVTPLVPLLLLGVVGGIALIGGWRRLLLFLRLKESRVPGTMPALPDSAAQAAFERVRDDLNTIRDRLRIPLYAASKVGPWWLLLAGVGVLLGLTGLSAIETPVGFEPRWLQISFLVAFVLGLFWILLTLVELIGIWRMSVQLLRAVAELPMVRAFDRLPTRMVLYPPSGSRDQAVVDRSNPLIDRQNEVLANGYDRFKTGLQDCGLWLELGSEARVACDRFFQAPDSSEGRRATLKLREWWSAIDKVLPVLAYFWKRRSSVASYATTTGPGSKPPDDAEEWPGLEDRPRDKRNNHEDDQDHDYGETDTGSRGREAIRVGAVATLQRWESVEIPLTRGALTPRVDIGAVTMMSRRESKKVPAAELRRWLRDAEDLIALVLARQIAWLRAYCKSIVTFLVVGLLALTLALTSYPFQPQGFLLTATVLLAAVTAIVVVIAVQANRDEVLSRINKTTPNHFTLDRQFLLTLVTYVVPLLGMLGALSYGMSDVIRSWFEPLFR